MTDGISSSERSARPLDRPHRGCKRVSAAARVRPEANGGVTTTLAANPSGTGAEVANAPEVPLPPLTPHGAHPRIALTTERLARLKKLAQSKAPAWASLERTCADATSKTIPSGYEAWDWSLAALSCGIVHRTTGDATAGRTGVTYLRALLDDKTKVGDGEGGDTVIRHDSGYPIRTRGSSAPSPTTGCIDAPGMTLEPGRAPSTGSSRGPTGTRARATCATSRSPTTTPATSAPWPWPARPSRATTRAGPSCGARSACSCATSRRRSSASRAGSGPRAGSTGPAPPSLALYAVTEHVTPPWPAQILPYRTHALQPDGVHVYDNGDWSEKPAVANAAELDAVALAASGDASPRPLAAPGRRARSRRRRRARGRSLRLAGRAGRRSRRPRPRRGRSAARRDELPRDRHRRCSRAPRVERRGVVGVPERAPFRRSPAPRSRALRRHARRRRALDRPQRVRLRLVARSQHAADRRSERGHAVRPQPGPRATGSKLLRFDDGGTYVHALGDFTSAYEPPRFADDGSAP